MKKQRGQSALEFALMAPLVLFMILTAIYGGAAFIQFMNYNNEARRIARDIAVTNADQRATLLEKYKGEAKNSEGKTLVGVYIVTLKTQLIKDNADVTTSAPTTAEEVHVRFDFDLPDGRKFPFDFPPSHFATSYRMKIEKDY